jgi:hypothetical protein
MESRRKDVQININEDMILNTSVKNFDLLSESASSIADNCHAWKNIELIIFNKLGILFATAYNPFAAIPIKKVIIYRSDAFITHHINALGIKGVQYINISLVKVNLILLNEINFLKPPKPNKINPLIALAIINDKKYPSIPISKVRRNNKESSNENTAVEIPVTANNFNLPIPLANCKKRVFIV